jgi:hypothetical protein
VRGSTTTTNRPDAANRRPARDAPSPLRLLWLLPGLVGCPGSLSLAGDGGDPPDGAGGDAAVEAESCDPDIGGSVSRAEHWVVTLGGAGCTEGEAWAVAATAAGGPIVVGSTRRAGTGYVESDVWMARFDVHGNLRWQQLVGDAATDIGEAVTELDDGTVVVVGGYERPPIHSGLQPWLAAFGPDGALRWQRTVDGPGLSKLTAVAAADDTIVVAGDVPAVEGEFCRPWLAGFDADGGLRWQWRWGDGNRWIWIEQLVALPGGDFAAAGYLSDSPAEEQDIWLARFDRSGTLRWQRRLAGVGSEGLVGLVPFEDGLAAAGFVLEDDWWTSRALVMTFGGDGELRNSVAVEAPFRIHPEGIAAVPGEGLYLVGGRSHGATALQNRLLLIRLDERLAPTADAELELQPWGRFHHVVAGEAGDLYAAGRTIWTLDEPWRDTRMAVARVTADLRFGDDCPWFRVPSLTWRPEPLAEVEPALWPVPGDAVVVEASATVRPSDVPVRVVCGE